MEETAEGPDVVLLIPAGFWFLLDCQDPAAPMEQQDFSCWGGGGL